MYAAAIPPGEPLQAEFRQSAERLAMEFEVIAQYRARTGAADRVQKALRKMVTPTRAEPGNLTTRCS